MTEMQAVIGKVQLGKIDKVLKMQKERYHSLSSSIGSEIKMRDIPKNSKITYDTFIFFENNKNKRNKIIKILNKEKFGTKNLPDAIKWHCASYWDHALEKKEINKVVNTKKILATAIAVPISLKRSVLDYRKLGKLISKINN